MDDRERAEKVNAFVNRPTEMGSAEQSIATLVRAAVLLGSGHPFETFFDPSSEQRTRDHLQGFVSATSQATDRELTADDLWGAIREEIRARKEATS